MHSILNDTSVFFFSVKGTASVRETSAVTCLVDPSVPAVDISLQPLRSRIIRSQMCCPSF